MLYFKQVCGTFQFSSEALFFSWQNKTINFLLSKPIMEPEYFSFTFKFVEITIDIVWPVTLSQVTNYLDCSYENQWCL